MSTPNPLARIEREAKEYAALFKYGSEYRQPAYSDGALAQMNRAAPVVKVLEDRLKEWEASQEMERKTVDLINSVTTSDECRVPYPDIPAWVTQYKQILETYKADQ